MSYKHRLNNLKEQCYATDIITGEDVCAIEHLSCVETCNVWLVEDDCGRLYLANESNLIDPYYY